jgi:hypothetical protein
VGVGVVVAVIIAACQRQGEKRKGDYQYQKNLSHLHSSFSQIQCQAPYALLKKAPV